MLFFRSEEALQEWCRAADRPIRPRATLGQLWKLAEIWYAGRLDPTTPPRTPTDVAEIFAGIGLDDPHWDPRVGR